ncbi:MAG TPA: hypothetical protein VK627_09995, partial [Edaphobacter sp.]|nr:hypothetical protein [Edaphobacter sp.]
FASQINIFQTARPISDLVAGKSLRIVDPQKFRVVFTVDQWATTLVLESRPVGFSGFFADIPSNPQQSSAIIFTLCWITEGQPDYWLGRNIEISVTPQPAPVKS